MAIYHFSVKMLSRSDGRDAVAAAAYRAGEKLKNEKTGETHDYTKKRNVISSHIITPVGVEKKINREELWNKTELAEKRKNSCLAREFEVALPAELPLEAQTKLAVDFAREIVEKYKIAADVAIHKPDRRGDERNVHAHILTTTRRVSENGELGEKARELDDYKTRAAVVEKMRERWADMVNAELERYGRSERIDHRTLEAQGIDRAPQIHVGVHATQMERRGIPTERGEKNRRRQAFNKRIYGLETELTAAVEQEKAAAARPQSEEKARQEVMEREKQARQATERKAQEGQRKRQEQAAAQPQPKAKQPVSPTQKPVEGAKVEKTANDTPKPQEAAKKAVIEAEKLPYTGEQVKEARMIVDAAISEHMKQFNAACLEKIREYNALAAEKQKELDAWKKQEPKRADYSVGFGLIMFEKRYQKALEEWREQRDKLIDDRDDWQRRARNVERDRTNAWDPGINAKKAVYKAMPEMAKIVEWAREREEQQKKLEQERRLRERLKKRQQQKSRGFDITD